MVNGESNTVVQDPFRLALNAAVVGDFQSAEKFFGDVEGFSGGHSSLSKIRKVLSGEEAITEVGGLYVIGDITPEVSDSIQRCNAYYSQEGLGYAPGIILNLNNNLNNFAATFPLVDGWYYISIDTEGLLPSLIHEVGHCYFNSKNRFLDEAAAYYYETRFLGEYPHAVEENICSFESFLDLHALISYDADDDPFFEKLIPGKHFWVHSKGARLFGMLLDSIGVEKLLGLYRKLSKKMISEHINYLAVYLRSELGDGADTLVEQFDSPEVWTTSINNVDVEYRYVTGEVDSLSVIYQEFFEFLQSGGCASDIEDKALLAITAVAFMKNSAGNLSRAEAIVVKSRLARKVSTMNRDSARYYFYRSCYSIVNLIIGSDTINQLMTLEDAAGDLERGLEFDQEDAILLVCLSRLEWFTPEDLEERKGSKDRSLVYLKRASMVKGYAEILKPQVHYYEQMLQAR